MIDWGRLDIMSIEMAGKVESAYTEVIHILHQEAQGKTAQEIAIIMNETNIEAIMQAKLVNVFAEYQAGIILILEDTILSGVITEEFLTSTLNQSLNYLSQEFINGTSIAMRNEIFKGIAGGLEASEVIDAMRELGFDERHLQTIVKSGFAQYDNAITNAMASESPDNSMWVYIGAYDGKTRPACEKKILSSPATKAQVIAAFGNLDNEVWNCRHKWEPVTSDIVGQGYEEKKL